MNTVMKIDSKDIDAIPFQEASLDIWDKKYRLTAKDGTPIDKTMDDTYKRVARALADVEREELREHWYERFLWALRRGAIPAGRVTSNAGALAHKPATSTINCTVSGTIRDSMDDILGKVHEAGLTLKAGCGIGYEHSTLRPRGAYVSGAGAYTSGPLSFMDIFDKMCFTVSSAGGRRGAQMGTFDVGHPDVMEFIRAKRESGRLRQFNLSLLITDEFMQAVRRNGDWKLAFPLSRTEYEAERPDLGDTSKFVWRDWPIHDGYVVNEAGQVACKIYKTLPAQRMWDVIMTSTYDFAEPGFILIDRVNEMNNNWWCENIRATNPCVTADTRLATQFGMVRIGDLCAAGPNLQTTVDRRALGEGAGVAIRPAVPAFMTASSADVFRVLTDDGYEIKATEWHDFYTTRGKITLKELKPGDELLIQSGKGQFGSCGSRELGELVGTLTRGDSCADRGLAERLANHFNGLIAASMTVPYHRRARPVAVRDRQRRLLRIAIIRRHLEQFYGIGPACKTAVPELIWRGTEACVKGYLRGLFHAAGAIGQTPSPDPIRLAGGERSLLRDVQMLLANFGVFSRLERCPRGQPISPHGMRSTNPDAEFQLVIAGLSRTRFLAEIASLDAPAAGKRPRLVHDNAAQEPQSFVSRIAAIQYAGREAVFDTTQHDHNTVIFNGIVTGQCGEQPLPPYGSCLLGSVNLTRFVRDPFTDRARFDWEEYRQVVKIFARMLDNVVEINGLPLAQQRDEILRKRRHGMGFLGLGSALALLQIRYGSPESVKFTEDVAREMALAGWEEALELAREKGPAPIMLEEFTVTPEMLRKRPEMARDGWKPGDRLPGRILHARYSRYMQRIAKLAPDLVSELAAVGARYTHHTSIAPTGTISLSLANNASNGIEPSFAHHYFRNVIRPGRKTKEKIDVYSYELLAYRELINPRATPGATAEAEKLPEYFAASEDITPKEHVDVQAAAQRWVDSSISKTANVPTDFPYERFKDIYLYAYEQDLKGCTTFRFNPEAFQGVLVKEQDLKNTVYKFTLDDGTVVEARGDDEIEYDGERHSAANLFDALREGYYGRY